MKLASRGQRDMDSGVTPIDDAAELEQVRRQARQVHLKSAGVAVMLTLLAILI